MYNFQTKMKEWGITSLDDPNLDNQFITEAKEFLKKVENKELDEEATKKADENLVELFEARHNENIVDSEELKAEKVKNQALIEKNEETRKANLIKQAAIDVSKNTNLESLEKLKGTYGEIPEALKIIEDKIKWVKDQQGKSQGQKDEKELEAERLRVEEENRKAAADKPTKDKIAGLKKLASIKGYYATYNDLKNIGIQPTGDDMTIHGYRLIRQYSFKVYEIVAPKEPEVKK